MDLFFALFPEKWPDWLRVALSATIPSGFTKDTWITSFELRPSDLTVTHHICASFVPHRENVKYYEWNWSESPRDEEGVATDAGATPLRCGRGSPARKKCSASILNSRDRSAGSIDG